MSESALIIAVPEAEPVVGNLRDRFDPVARLGVPAHVTVLYPFMSPELIDDTVLVTIRVALCNVAPFDFSLARVERFPEATYLAPEPVAPFIALTKILVRAFPDFPPYGGTYNTIIPHLTVADHDEANAATAERELSVLMESRGAIAATCTAVTLMANVQGVWETMEVFGLREAKKFG